jgi:hypothetical protein
MGCPKKCPTVLFLPICERTKNRVKSGENQCPIRASFARAGKNLSPQYSINLGPLPDASISELSLMNDLAAAILFLSAHVGAFRPRNPSSVVVSLRVLTHNRIRRDVHFRFLGRANTELAVCAYGALVRAGITMSGLFSLRFWFKRRPLRVVSKPPVMPCPL